MPISIATHHHASHQQSQFDCREIRIGSGPQCELVTAGDSGIAEVHCIVSVQPHQKIRIKNFGRSIVLNHGARIHRDSSVVADLPATFSVGDTQVQIIDLNTHYHHDHALRGLNTDRGSKQSQPAIQSVAEVAPGQATLTAWLETVGDLQESVAGSKAFFKDAARTIYNPGGMDGCIILQPQDPQSATAESNWNITASHIPYPNCNISFRPDLVQTSVDQRCTIFHNATQLNSETASKQTHTAVVCPVIGDQSDVIAVVYGFRTQHSTNNRIGARALEVQFVQLIAKSIASAMKRIEKEAQASRSRILLEQAFSPKVVRQLEVDPQILQGVTREVTVMFADLRDFSSISEKVGPKTTYRMLTDVMDRFSEIIARHDGVIIDFYGDGISAFWNAPLRQPDHPLAAVSAAHEILSALPELNSLWGRSIAGPLKAGIGVHCGDAQVGNAGSSTRLKYGPQGPTVNIASRLETTTKSLGVPLVVSHSVAHRVDTHYHGRRICGTYLKGMEQSIGLYELFEKPLSSKLATSLNTYDEALILFEQENFADCISLLCELDLDMPDSATEYLLRQAMQKNSHDLERRKQTPSKPEVTAITFPQPANANSGLSNPENQTIEKTTGFDYHI